MSSVESTKAGPVDSSLPACGGQIDVLHLLFSYNVGGTEALLLSMMQAFRTSQLKHAVLIVNDSFSEDLLQKLQATGVPVFLLKRREKSRSPVPILTLLAIVRRHRVRLVHTHEPAMVPLALLVKASRPRLRLVNSFHNTNLPRLESPKTRFAFNKVYDRLVAISKAVKRDCESRGIGGEMVILNNAIDVARFASVPRKVPSEAEEPLLRLICVARFFLRQKAQDRLLEAAAECRKRGVRFVLRLVGNADNRDMDDYRKLVDMVTAAGLEDVVEFVLNKTNVEDYLAGADLFVLPSHFEGFGIAVLEAMAAGLPVVVSRVDGLSEIVTDDENGFFIRPANVEDLVERITWASHNLDRIRSMSKAAQARAAQFDIASYARRYESLYREVLEA